MRRWLALGALVACVAWSGGARAAEVEILRQNGPAGLRFNIAVLGDGYRTADQAKLKTDAQAIIDYLFGVTPLKQYAQFFNVKLVHVISNDDGADNGSYGKTRDTALDAYFKCENIDRLLCVNYGKAQAAAAQDVPEFNFVIVLVNDPMYGGSGGQMGVSSSNVQSFEVLAHEMGHSLAHLADEYSDKGDQAPCDQKQDCPEANATLRTTRDQIKWQDWIDATTPLPTLDVPEFGSVVGLFEGTRYMPTGVYRPQQNCKMRDLSAEYCSVCTEQLVRSIWTLPNIQMIESALPAQQAVQSDACDAIALSVTSPPITPSTYKYMWSVDGNVQLETTNAIQLTPGILMAGTHQVSLSLVDTTAMVRTDPNAVLKHDHSWTVTVSKSDCPTTPAGGAGSPGVGSVLAGSGGLSGAAGSGASVGAATAGISGLNPLPLPPPRETSGCGCALPGSAAPQGWPAAALAFSVWFGRRRGCAAKRGATAAPGGRRRRRAGARVGF